MQAHNPTNWSCEGAVASRRAANTAIDGAYLSAHHKKIRRSDLKLSRCANSFKAIPESLYTSLLGLGRGKYRSIVVATYMSLLWDGWKSKRKKKTNRVPSNKVVLTRRMMAQHFDMGESTAGDAIDDLIQNKIIIVDQKAVFSGIQGKNSGTKYRLPWMENIKKVKYLKVYWGLLVSKEFLGLSVTLQAVLILLHSLHNRSKNRLTIQPSALSQYGIHRNRLPKYITKLTATGLLVYIENYDYEFSWIDRDGKPDFDRIKKFRCT